VTDLPKKFSFGNEGEGAAPPPPSSPDATRKPRGFNFPTSEPAPPVPEPVERRPRTFNIQAAPVEPVVERAPKILAPTTSEPIYARKERPRTVVDNLLDKATAIDPSIGNELRGSITELLKLATTETILEWGNINLIPLQKASNVQAEIANELRRINAVEALTEAKDAACRPPTLFDRVTGKKPEYYEARLVMVKDDLLKLMLKSERQRKEYHPEVRDLHLDGVAMAVTHPEWTDPVMIQLGNSRTKTLLQAHQTGVMLLQTLENCVAQCGQYIEQIDGLLSTTIPQWKMLQQSK
jgi:hypothetical protein